MAGGGGGGGGGGVGTRLQGAQSLSTYIEFENTLDIHF